MGIPLTREADGALLDRQVGAVMTKLVTSQKSSAVRFGEPLQGAYAVQNEDEYIVAHAFEAELEIAGSTVLQLSSIDRFRSFYLALQYATNLNNLIRLTSSEAASLALYARAMADILKCTETQKVLAVLNRWDCTVGSSNTPLQMLGRSALTQLAITRQVELTNSRNVFMML